MSQLSGQATRPSMLANGMYELVCCGLLHHNRTQTEEYAGFTYGVMVLRGLDSDDVYTVILDMPKIMPQLQQTIKSLRASEVSFCRIADFGGLWMKKDDLHFVLLRDGGSAIVAEFEVEAVERVVRTVTPEMYQAVDPQGTTNL